MGENSIEDVSLLSTVSTMMHLDLNTNLISGSISFSGQNLSYLNVRANVDLESVSLSATSSSLTTLYATNTKIDNILTLALPGLMEHLSIGGQSSTSTSSLDDTNVLAVIESLTKLVELRISSSNLSVIPDLSNSASSLVKLYIDGNPAIRS
ncbi:hypothetical protein ADUPG1_002248, partial [Aduncisulcus paluster]